MKSLNFFRDELSKNTCIFNCNIGVISNFSILIILGNDQSETGLLGSTSKILGTSRIYFEDPCGGEKNLGSVCFEQGEAFIWFRNLSRG